MIKIGTRNSKLALIQTDLVIQKITQIFPDLKFKIVEISTAGDTNFAIKTDDGGIKGMFTKEIDNKLITGEIDIAIHSLKDMASVIPQGLKIATVLEREDSRDAFICNKYSNLKDLPIGSTIGTSSIRRKLMLANYRKDLKIIHFRGNLQTRLKKLDNGEVDAIILAVSGLNRIGLQNRITQIIPTNIMMPAISQGAIGVVCLEKNHKIANIFSTINHPQSMSAIKTERAFAEAMNANCGTPLGVWSKISNNKISIDSCFIDEKTNKVYTAKTNGYVGQEIEIGKKLANIIFE